MPYLKTQCHLIASPQHHHNTRPFPSCGCWTMRSVLKSTQFSVRRMSNLSSSIPEKVRSTAASGSQVYESKRAVHEYLLFHYGHANDHFAFEGGPRNALNFPARCAAVCNDHHVAKANSRALDIGCAVGGSSFELAKHFNEVVGLDFSQHFVDAANKMKDQGRQDFEILVRGHIYKNCSTNLDQSVDRSKVTFQQGDACNLNESIGKFDTILASNLLCRLPNPCKFLTDVPNFLKPGGTLVLISPYSWLEEYTPVSEWIGGVAEAPNSGEEVKLILSQLGTKMELIHREDMPFLIREHERKYQYGVSDCMVWRRTD